MKRVFLLIAGLLVPHPAFAGSEADRGHALYLSYGCAVCHGQEGKGDGINASKFNPPPSDFHHAENFRHGADAQSIKQAIRYGIKEDASIMPGFADIPQPELDQLAAYI